MSLGSGSKRPHSISIEQCRWSCWCILNIPYIASDSVKEAEWLLGTAEKQRKSIRRYSELNTTVRGVRAIHIDGWELRCGSAKPASTERHKNTKPLKGFIKWDLFEARAGRGNGMKSQASKKPIQKPNRSGDGSFHWKPYFIYMPNQYSFIHECSDVIIPVISPRGSLVFANHLL